MLAIFPGDSAVLLLVLVMGFFAGMGIVADGIRMVLVLAASVVSFFVAPLLGGYVPEGLLPANPIWRHAGMGDIFAFLILMVLLFVGIHFLHRWIEIEVKYKLPERKHKDWARVNSVLGLCVGGVTGVLYFLAIAGLVSPVGYAAAQMPAVAPASDPVGYRLAGRLYKDFQTLGVDRAACAFNPATTNYYAAVDVAGLIYNNFSPNDARTNVQFRARLLSYPGLVDAAYNPKVAGMLMLNNSNAFLVDVCKRSGLSHLLASQQFQAAYGDPQVRAQLAQVDLEDLRKYMIFLNDPVQGSTKYNSAGLMQQGLPRILGRWVLDLPNTMEQFERTFTQMNEREKLRLKDYLEVMGEQMSLSFSGDNSGGNFYFEAKFFHYRPLAREASGMIPRIPSNVRIDDIKSVAFPVLLDSGQWQGVDDSRFRATLRLRNLMKANDPNITECPVLIECGPTQIIVTLADFENEKYVFRRQKN